MTTVLTQELRLSCFILLDYPNQLKGLLSCYFKNTLHHQVQSSIQLQKLLLLLLHLSCIHCSGKESQSFPATGLVVFRWVIFTSPCSVSSHRCFGLLFGHLLLTSNCRRFCTYNYYTNVLCNYKIILGKTT